MTNRLYKSAFWLILIISSVISILSIGFIIEAEVIRQQAQSCEKLYFQYQYEKNFGKSLSSSEADNKDIILKVFNQTDYLRNVSNECKIDSQEYTTNGTVLNFQTYNKFASIKYLAWMLAFWLPLVLLVLGRRWLYWLKTGSWEIKS